MDWLIDHRLRPTLTEEEVTNCNKLLSHLKNGPILSGVVAGFGMPLSYVMCCRAFRFSILSNVAILCVPTMLILPGLSAVRHKQLVTDRITKEEDHRKLSIFKSVENQLFYGVTIPLTGVLIPFLLMKKKPLNLTFKEHWRKQLRNLRTDRLFFTLFFIDLLTQICSGYFLAKKELEIYDEIKEKVVFKGSKKRKNIKNAGNSMFTG